LGLGLSSETALDCVVAGLRSFPPWYQEHGEQNGSTGFIRIPPCLFFSTGIPLPLIPRTRIVTGELRSSARKHEIKNATITTDDSKGYEAERTRPFCRAFDFIFLDSMMKLNTAKTDAVDQKTQCLKRSIKT
jgi:hypothetical protein